MNDKFTYDYSAPTKEEIKEIEDIRRRYGGQKKEKDKLFRLRELDNKVKNPPTVWSLILGIGGTLIFGLGLTMVLEWEIFLWGVIVAIIGCVPMALAVVVYNRLLEKNKKKYGEEILRLTDELLSETED